MVERQVMEGTHQGGRIRKGRRSKNEALQMVVPRFWLPESILWVIDPSAQVYLPGEIGCEPHVASVIIATEEEAVDECLDRRILSLGQHTVWMPT